MSIFAFSDVLVALPLAASAPFDTPVAIKAYSQSDMTYEYVWQHRSEEHV